MNIRGFQWLLLLLLAFCNSPASLIEGARREDSRNDYGVIAGELPLVQSEFTSWPYLLQKVNYSEESTSYNLLTQAGREEYAFRRDRNDQNRSLLIFPTGLYNWTVSVPGKYVVLKRKAESFGVYSMSFAYLRDAGKLKSVEWSREEVELAKEPTTLLSRLQSEICTELDASCGFLEYFLATCELVKSICVLTRTPLPGWHLTEDRKSGGGDIHGYKLLEVREMPNVTTTKPLSLNLSTPGSTTTPTYLIGRDVSSSTTVGTEPPSSLDALLQFIPNSSAIIANSPQPFKEPALTQYLRSDTERSASLPTDLLTMSPYQGSSPFGLLFQDLQENPLINFKMGEFLIKELALLKSTQANQTNSVSSLSWLDSVGNGYGNYRKIFPSFVEHLILFYLVPLNLNDNVGIVNEIRSWLMPDVNLLGIRVNKFKLLLHSEILTRRMLAPHKFKSLLSATIFSSYGSIYRSSFSLFRDRTPSQLCNEISNFLSLVINVYMKVIQAAIGKLKGHLIKIIRFLAKTLKQKFYALSLHYHNSYNQSSEEERRTSYFDALSILGLKEFILNGLEPVIQGEDNAEAFQTYFQLNQKRIRFFLASYGIFENHTLESFRI